MTLTSNFQKLTPLLLKVIYSEYFTETDKDFLNTLQNSPSYTKLPSSLSVAEVTGQANLFLLRKAVDSLQFFVLGDINSALEAARATLQLKLGKDPFRGIFYNFAAKLAEFIGDGQTQIAFETRYRTYKEIYHLEGVLLGTEQALNPEVMDLLDEIVTAEIEN